MKNVLFLSPHTDDAEVAAGGTIHRLISEGINVYILAFSWCDDELLKKEYANATKILGIPEKNRTLWSYPRRYFYVHRQEILDGIIKYVNEKDFHFDTVFTSSEFDAHQDHHVIYQEALRAFKQSTILCYELSWNNIQFVQDAFVKLSEQDVNAKIDAMMQYKTQINRKRDYFDKTFIRSVLRRNGASIREKYAEIFHCVKWVL